MIESPSRRDIIATGALGAALNSLAAPRPAGAEPDTGNDPRTTAEGQIKLLATLDGSPAFWTYSGVIYAVRPAQRPVPILTLAGGQSSWGVRRADGSYMVGGAILTFFRDPGSGAFLDAFDNPFTGRRNPVRPNLLTGGATIYPADGSSARAEGQVNNAVIAPKGFGQADPRRALGAVRWSLLGPSVMLMTDRSWNVAAQPQLEAQTQSADRAGFFDPKVTKLPTRFTATTIIPWMTWMDMGDAPGHLVWHSSGEKVFTIDDLPADYVAHAGQMLDHLTTRPSS